MLIILLKEMKHIKFLFLSLCIVGTASGAVVDTIQIYSQSMQKNIKSVIMTPVAYSSVKELPVVYLLHGYSGNHLDWINKAKGFEKAAGIGMVQ
jgi:hypothetical protein